MSPIATHKVITVDEIGAADVFLGENSLPFSNLMCTFWERFQNFSHHSAGEKWTKRDQIRYTRCVSYVEPNLMKEWVM